MSTGPDSVKRKSSRYVFGEYLARDVAVSFIPAIITFVVALVLRIDLTAPVVRGLIYAEFVLASIGLVVAVFFDVLIHELYPRRSLATLVIGISILSLIMFDFAFLGVTLSMSIQKMDTDYSDLWVNVVIYLCSLGLSLVVFRQKRKKGVVA